MSQEAYKELAAKIKAIYEAAAEAKRFADVNGLYFQLDEDYLVGVDELVESRDEYRRQAQSADWNSSGSYMC